MKLGRGIPTLGLEGFDFCLGWHVHFSLDGFMFAVDSCLGWLEHSEA